MPRVTHVKSARKAIPHIGVEKGDSYYHWSFRVGTGSRKCYSKTPPRPSQLTNSEFMSQALALAERLEDMKADENMDTERDEIADEADSLAGEEESKVDNMPDSLQSGETGEMMRERAQALRDWAEELRQVEVRDDMDDDERNEALEQLQMVGEPSF